MLVVPGGPGDIDVEPAGLLVRQVVADELRGAGTLAIRPILDGILHIGHLALELLAEQLGRIEQWVAGLPSDLASRDDGLLDVFVVGIDGRVHLSGRDERGTGERGALIDEAYEFYNDPEPESALRHIDDIDATNLFVVGAATKGLQVPGMRVGWVVASRQHIELFRNYSSFGMGGVSRASQLYVTELMELSRVAQARSAISAYFTSQRKRYGEVLGELGIELYTGDGGFYHWGRLPNGLTGARFNELLFAHDAGILPGRLCDMARRGDDGKLGTMMRFSFGPLPPDSFDEDARILRAVLG